MLPSVSFYLFVLISLFDIFSSNAWWPFGCVTKGPTGSSVCTRGLCPVGLHCGDGEGETTWSFTWTGWFLEFLSRGQAQGPLHSAIKAGEGAGVGLMVPFTNCSLSSWSGSCLSPTLHSSRCSWVRSLPSSGSIWRQFTSHLPPAKP